MNPLWWTQIRAVVRMEMHNEEDVLVAVGTGTYMIG